MTAEPSASIWEVTRLILESPDRSPSEIAQLHGYSAEEVADLVPIFLDTARTDWSRHAAGDLTTAGADQDAELYLRDLAGSGSIDVTGFGAAAADPDADGDLDGDPAAEDPPAADGEALPPDLGDLLDGPGAGGPGAGGPDGGDAAFLDDPADPGDPALDDPTDGDPTDGDPTDGGPTDGDPTDGAPTGDGGVEPDPDAAAGLPEPDGERFALGEDDPFAGDPYDTGPDGDLGPAEAVAPPDGSPDVDLDDVG